eukprot:4074034-Pleurochrysis_carterae.AAC.1
MQLRKASTSGVIRVIVCSMLSSDWLYARGTELRILHRSTQTGLPGASYHPSARRPKFQPSRSRPPHLHRLPYFAAVERKQLANMAHRGNIEVAGL